MNSKLRTFYKEVVTLFYPYKDILWFLFLFIMLDFGWKIFVNEGTAGSSFIVLGKDLTQAVHPISEFTARAVYWIIHDLMGYSNYTINDTTIAFPRPSMPLLVVPGCTGIKQIIVFTLLMILYFGPKKKKYWFIPLSIIILNFLNVLRIVATAFIVKDGFPQWFIGFNEWYNQTTWVNVRVSYNLFYYDWFQFFHKDVFRWLYYDGVMFLLWLFWQEKFNLPYQREKKKKTIEDKAL